MDNIKKATLLILVFTLLLQFSCKKTWTCSIPSYTIVAIKGTDTIKNEVWLSLANSFTDPSYFQNLVVYYQNNGYTLKIDTVIDQEVNIVDRSALKAYQDDGFKCN